MNRSAIGRAEQTGGDGHGQHRLMQPVTEHEGQHHADRGGAPVELSGHGIIRLCTRTSRLRCLTGGGNGRRARVVEKFEKSIVKPGKIGTSGPTETDGSGPQRPRQASSMDIGREGAICEYIEIMQMPPGSSE